MGIVLPKIDSVNKKQTFKIKEAFRIFQMQDVNTCFVLYNIISESSVEIMKLVSTVMNIYIICLHPVLHEMLHKISGDNYRFQRDW